MVSCCCCCGGGTADDGAYPMGGGPPPPNTPFKQQTSRAFIVSFSPNCVIWLFCVLGVICLALGIVFNFIVAAVVTAEVDYTHLRLHSHTSNVSWVSVTVPDRMDPPIFVYYKIDGMYQNHRRYVKGFAPKQLSAAAPTDVSDCKVLSEWEGTALYPCGLVPHSLFNDTIQARVETFNPNVIFNLTDAQDNWERDDLVWESDLKKKFVQPAPANYPSALSRVGPGGFTLPEVDDPDFVSWMKLAGLPNFQKLYRKIERTAISKGSVLHFGINNQFPVNGFGGSKSIFVTTDSVLGGKNFFLPMSFICIGIASLLAAMVFCVKTRVGPSYLGKVPYAPFLVESQ